MPDRKIAVIGSTAARKNHWKGNQLVGTDPSEFLLSLKAHGFTVVVMSSRLGSIW